MDNEKVNNDFDETLRKGLENIPDEQPTEENWKQLRNGLQKEGLLKTASNGRKYFLLFLLCLLVGGSISVPLLMNRYGLDFSFISPSGNSANENKIIPIHSERKK